MRIGLDRDLDGWRPEEGQTDKYGQLIEDREYNDRDYDRSLILEKRTAVVAAKMTEFLRASNRFAKTIIFCENVDHAERMRQAMVNANPDLAAANPKYVLNLSHTACFETQLAASRHRREPPLRRRRRPDRRLTAA